MRTLRERINNVHMNLRCIKCNRFTLKKFSEYYFTDTSLQNMIGIEPINIFEITRMYHDDFRSNTTIVVPINRNKNNPFIQLKGLKHNSYVCESLGYICHNGGIGWSWTK